MLSARWCLGQSSASMRITRRGADLSAHNCCDFLKETCLEHSQRGWGAPWLLWMGEVLKKILMDSLLFTFDAQPHLLWRLHGARKWGERRDDRQPVCSPLDQRYWRLRQEVVIAFWMMALMWQTLEVVQRLFKRQLILRKTGMGRGSFTSNHQ